MYKTDRRKEKKEKVYQTHDQYIHNWKENDPPLGVSSNSEMKLNLIRLNKARKYE